MTGLLFVLPIPFKPPYLTHPKTLKLVPTRAQEQQHTLLLACINLHQGQEKAKADRHVWDRGRRLQHSTVTE